MADFRTIKEAKDFLANRIVAEAARENVPLSEVERKMLYWSETGWTLPNMKQVGAEFERDYEDNAYERKVALLIANLTANHHHGNEDEETKWDAAVDKLSEGDHYLSVLVRVAHPPGGGFLPTLETPVIRSTGDFIKLLLASFAFIFAIFTLFALENHFFPDGFWQTLGTHIDNRAIPFFLVLILGAGYFLVPRLWQLLRSRSDRH